MSARISCGRLAIASAFLMGIRIFFNFNSTVTYGKMALVYHTYVQSYAPAFTIEAGHDQAIISCSYNTFGSKIVGRS